MYEVQPYPYSGYMGMQIAGDYVFCAYLFGEVHVFDLNTGKLVVNAVLDAHPETRLVWLPKRHDLIDHLAHALVDGDVCISMGCGDIATLPDEVQSRRAELRVERRQHLS